jgi:hypothetical protein
LTAHQARHAIDSDPAKLPRGLLFDRRPIEFENLGDRAEGLLHQRLCGIAGHATLDKTAYLEAGIL